MYVLLLYLYSLKSWKFFRQIRENCFFGGLFLLQRKTPINGSRTSRTGYLAVCTGIWYNTLGALGKSLGKPIPSPLFGVSFPINSERECEFTICPAYYKSISWDSNHWQYWHIQTQWMWYLWYFNLPSFASTKSIFLL